jgi:hypothetical protein
LSAASPADNVRLISGEDARRSTRLDRSIPIAIAGKTKFGQLVQERTCSVSVNLHGCRYSSRHDYPVGTWIDLQVLEADGQTKMPAMRAQVRSLHPPQSTRELNQVGVELQIPANIWGIPAPPEDWLRLRRTIASATQLASAAALAKEFAAPPVNLPPALGQIGLQPRTSHVAEFPAPAPSAAPSKPESMKESAPAKRDRVVITPDQLILALQGRIQQAVDKAVRTAVQTEITTKLDEAVARALEKIEEASRTRERHAEAFSAGRVETLVKSSQEEILGRLEAGQEIYRSRAAEMAERFANLASEMRNELNETKKFAEKISSEIEPQIRAGLNDTLNRVNDDFEAAAARVCDRQIMRMLENKQMVTREVGAQLEARAAETRALLLTAATSALDEFRRQLELNMDLALSEATQKIMSSLASLDAENRAACEERRRALVGDVARTAEQSADQFRKGIKAFLYSCLVAAVSAVDEHAQSTREGLVNDPGKVLHEFEARAESGENHTGGK